MPDLVTYYFATVALIAIALHMYVTWRRARGVDTAMNAIDCYVVASLWPITLTLMAMVGVHNSFRDISPEEKQYRQVQKLKRKKMNVEAAIVIEDDDGYVTGKPMVFPKIKNWKTARALVENIVHDDEACFAIHANSRGFLPDDKVLTVHALQFVYRSDKTDEVLSVETYENHEGPTTFLNRSWTE